MTQDDGDYLTSLGHDAAQHAQDLLTFLFLNAFIFLNMMIGIVLDVMQKESVAMELESGEGEAAELHGLRDDVRQLQEQLTRMESLLERRDR